MDFPPPEDHCLFMMSKIFELLSKPNLCDLSITVEDRIFWSHKCVLVTACPTLYDIILRESETAPRNNLQLSLQGLSSKGFEALLAYIYTGVPPDATDTDLYSNFIKACHALGITPSKRIKNENKSIRTESFESDTENRNALSLDEKIRNYTGSRQLVIEVSTMEDDFKNSDNEMSNYDIEDSFENCDPDHSHKENYVLKANLSTEDSVKCTQNGGDLAGEVDISSLFSVKKRLNQVEPIVNTQEIDRNPTPPKRIRRGRPRLSNDHIFPNEPPFICPFSGCPKECDTREKLKKHYRNHDQKKYSCQLCSKKFLYRKDVIVHSRTHTGEKPFQCAICTASFSQKCTLQNHMARHNTENPPRFPCPSCEKVYTSARSLSLHTKEKHADKNESLYDCKYCGKAYQSRSAYVMHVKSGCNAGFYSCPRCGHKYKRKESYNAHVQKCEKTFEYECGLCESVFRHRSVLLNHVKFSHNTPVRSEDMVAISINGAENLCTPDGNEENSQNEEILNLGSMVFLDLEKADEQ